MPCDWLWIYQRVCMCICELVYGKEHASPSGQSASDEHDWPPEGGGSEAGSDVHPLLQQISQQRPSASHPVSDPRGNAQFAGFAQESKHRASSGACQEQSKPAVTQVPAATPTCATQQASPIAPIPELPSRRRCCRAVFSQVLPRHATVRREQTRRVMPAGSPPARPRAARTTTSPRNRTRAAS